jgi:hypothetical protein
MPINEYRMQSVTLLNDKETNLGANCVLSSMIHRILPVTPFTNCENTTWSQRCEKMRLVWSSFICICYSKHHLILLIADIVFTMSLMQWLTSCPAPCRTPNVALCLNK